MSLIVLIMALAVALVRPPTRLAATSHARLSPECALPAIDTSDWITSTNAALGFSFRHPAAYREMRWTSSSPGLPLTSDWWHREGVVWQLQFSRRTTTDSIARATFGGRLGYHECSLATRYGAITVRLFREIGGAVDGQKPPEPYDVVIDWPPDRRKTSLHLETSSLDSTRMLEQLVIARSVTLSDQP